MEHPTWQEVGIPAILIDSIKQMKPCFLLDSLVHQIVFHNVKKLKLLYICMNCGKQYEPERNSEDISECESCGHRGICATQSLRFTKEKIPSYSRSNFCSLFDIIRIMDENYSQYFRVNKKTSLDWDWEGQYKVQFLGGDVAHATAPRVAVVKASLLCPYLWDSFYNWNTNSHRDALEQKYISQFINQWTSHCWR
jgi:DNA-directed RNA polymerase subunit RPC12/RpoP